jgi:hypothetical protein
MADLPNLPSRSVPLIPRTATPSNPSTKHSRAPTMTNEGQMLPPHQRRPRRCPPIKLSAAYIFKGLHPLYRREVIQDNHSKMTIYYTQPGYLLPGKIVNHGVQGIGNYRSHYKKFHPNIPTTPEEELLSRANEPVRPFFTNPATEQSHNERYRVLLLEFVTINNLSFDIVNQPETKALFSFLSLNTKQISRTTLINNLKAQYQVAEEETR